MGPTDYYMEIQPLGLYQQPNQKGLAPNLIQLTQLVKKKKYSAQTSEPCILLTFNIIFLSCPIHSDSGMNTRSNSYNLKFEKNQLITITGICHGPHKTAWRSNSSLRFVAKRVYSEPNPTRQKKKKIPPRQVTMHLTYILPGTGPFCPSGHRPLDPKCPTGHQTFMVRILAKLTFKGAACLSLMAGVFRPDSGGSLTQNGSLHYQFDLEGMSTER